ncbi:MAG TPA: IPTL-CTERM sorting domain-containing protein [Casimicrobiaceae bacterium]|nr:IPTL-CTERM sorting domain-containing protein [Casimicrobiaceae bacterium]
MHRCSLLATAAALVLCAAPLHAQLVTNGTLDTDASGWSLGGGCGDEAWDGANGNPPGSIRLNACGEPDSDPAASQTINGLVVGTTYIINVDVHLHVNFSGGGTGRSFGIFLNNEPATPLLLTEFLDGTWHTVTTSFVAASSSATLIFAGELDARTPGGPGITTDVSYYIDNISVAPVATTPSSVPALSEWALATLAVLVAALAALGLRRHRVQARRPGQRLV